MQTWTISNLAHVPHFADVVADRGWHAWWQNDGITLENYRAGLEPVLKGDSIPLGFVAHSGEHYLGSVLVIENDLETRPNLNPWIVALWVERAERGKGLAAALMFHAQCEAAKIGFNTLYLCAEQLLTPFYFAKDWTLIETDVNGLNVFEVFTI